MRTVQTALLPVVVVIGACQPEPEPEPVDTFPESADVTVRFRAQFGQNPVECRTQYEEVGRTNTRVRVTDLRFFVHEVALIADDGTSVPLDLDAGPFQGEGVALLDFENADGNCAGGTPDTHVALTGTVPGGRYTGLSFKIGVPFELNHRDLTASTEPPFDTTGLFVNATVGYRFFNLGLRSDGQPLGWPVWIHSTGCISSDGVVESCTSENIVSVTLPAFDVDADVVLVDLLPLLATSDLDRNATVTTQGGGTLESPPGCPSDPTDPDCAAIFVAYGLSSSPPNFVRAN